MIPLLPIEVELVGGCSGFSVTDETDYAVQLSPTFDIGRFYLGIRLINIVDPSGNNKIYCTQDRINDGSVPIQIESGYTTTIPLVNQYIPSSWNFYYSLQGNYTINIVTLAEIPWYSTLINLPLYNIGDVAVANYNQRYRIFQALVNSPTNDVSDATQWSELVLLQDFTLVHLATQTETPFQFPDNFLNSAIATQDCYLTNLECVISKLDCGFCCGGCENVLKNKNSIAVIKASLLVAELQLEEQSSLYTFYNIVLPKTSLTAPQVNGSYTPPLSSPSNEYIETVCIYSNAIKKICCCNNSAPCKPCSGDDTTTPDQVITQAEIAIAIANIMSDNFVYNLNTQVTLAKKLCCNDRKTLLAFLVANVLSIEQIVLTGLNYDCLNSILGFTSGSQDTGQNVLIASSGAIFDNQSGDLISYKQQG